MIQRTMFQCLGWERLQILFWAAIAVSTHLGIESRGQTIATPAIVHQSASAQQSLSVNTLPDPGRARMELDHAISWLHSHLSLGTQENAARWYEFLRWKDLDHELQESTPDLFKLEQFERHLRQNYAGLDYSPFVRFREALDNYIVALRYGSERERSIELLKAQIEKLTERIQAPASGSDLDRQRDIGLAIHYLSESRQATALTSQVRSHFSRPNARVLVSSDFLTSKFSRPVAEPNPVQEVILGTQITGSSMTLGQVCPQLIDNPRQATVQLQLSAMFSSNNRGLNRGVTIFTRGAVPIQAAETVTLGSTGLVALGNTSVDAQLNTDVLGIQHRLRIVRRIASKKVAQQQGLANAIGEERLENRLRNQFHQQLQGQLAEANQRITPVDPPELRRLGLNRPERTSWSSQRYLSLLWRQQNPKQLAAPSSCPIPVEATGATLQLHQSAISNLIDPVIGSRLIRNTDLARFAGQYTRQIPERILEESRSEPWSITMAAYHPVEIELDDNQVKFRIRITDMERGDQSLGQPATIIANYQIELFDNAIQLRRVGEVNIEFRSREARGSRATVLRSFLKSKFDKVFREQLLDQPVRPLDRLPAGAPAISIASITCDDGWIQAWLR